MIGRAMSLRAVGWDASLSVRLGARHAFMSSAEDGPRVTRDAGGDISGAGNVKGNVITFMSF